MQPSTPATVLLTAEDVQQWQKELVAAEVVVAELKRKLEAAAVFFPQEPKILPTSVHERMSGGSLSEAILVTISRSPVAMTPREIRDALTKAGFELASENYLYTAIKRLADRNLILKTDHGYVSSKGSSKEEGPDQKVGAPQGILTLSGGGVGAHPEVGGT